MFAAIRCFWLWQPERQVRLHQRHLLDAAAAHDWKKIDRFLAADFRDRYGHDKPWVLRESREILRQFFALTVHDSDTGVAFDPANAQKTRLARVSTRLRLEGTGTPVAQYAMQAVNSAQAPFEFSWKRQSWKPWDWRLVSAGHPLLARAVDADF